MQSIDEAAREFAEENEIIKTKDAFKADAEFTQDWLDIDKEIPEYYQPILADNGEYITVITRVSDGDEDFYPICGTHVCMYPDPIKWRPIELK